MFYVKRFAKGTQSAVAIEEVANALCHYLANSDTTALMAS